ncbi:uncharacterized protein [Trachinotus anak]|uniref:uncharacterized protein isoform X2 n=1 Tax=Trachinotus anak TaxID=443729 RepID=UPI0039F18069
MNFIYMIITMLTALAKGAMECNLSEATGPQQCLGALGKPLIFLLTNGTNKKTSLRRNSDVILDIKGDCDAAVLITNKYSDRSAFFANGTFNLETVTKNDSGDYTFERYDHDGKLLQKIDIHLEIQAPVSEPAVSQMCLSPEQMKVSCSSEGDRVEFILTLDSNLLIQTRAGNTDKQLTAGVSNVTIILHGQLTGVLTCNVRNNVSREETFIHLTSCKGSPSLLCLVTAAVTASIASLLLLLVLFLGITHFSKKTRPKTVNKDNADEVIYSDVRMIKPTRDARPNLRQSSF